MCLTSRHQTYIKGRSPPNEILIFTYFHYCAALYPQCHTQTLSLTTLFLSLPSLDTLTSTSTSPSFLTHTPSLPLLSLSLLINKLVHL